MVTIPKRHLGGLAVGTIGLGCMSISGVYGDADDAASEALIKDAIALGVDHFDSSDMYGWGHNEGVLGRALKGLRDKVVLRPSSGRSGIRVHPTAWMARRPMCRRPAKRR